LGLRAWLAPAIAGDWLQQGLARIAPAPVNGSTQSARA